MPYSGSGKHGIAVDDCAGSHFQPIEAARGHLGFRELRRRKRDHRCISGTPAPACPLTLAMRAVLHFTVTVGLQRQLAHELLTSPLIPLRDSLNLILWGLGSVHRRVVWAGHNLDFDAKGLFRKDTSEPGHPEAGRAPPEHTTT